MDKNEYKLKTEEMLELLDDGAYANAAQIADQIDWRRVKNASMLSSVSDIYELNGELQKSYNTLKIIYERSAGGRKIVYRLGELAVQIGRMNDAMDYYDEFVEIAPKDPNQYILRYQIIRKQNAPIEEQIAALEEFKKAEYIERWAYELAKLYQEAGMVSECLEECDDLILWFSEGTYVYQAMELKMQYKPLTPSQLEKYNNRYSDKSKSVTPKQKITPFKKPETRKKRATPVEDKVPVASENPEEDEEPIEEVPEPEKNTRSGNKSSIFSATMKLGEALDNLIHGAYDEPEPEPEPEVEESPIEEEPVIPGATPKAMDGLQTNASTEPYLEDNKETEVIADAPTVRLPDTDEILAKMRQQNAQTTASATEEAMVNAQITGQMNMADVLNEWEDSAKTAIKKAPQKVESILPPDIQKMIDDIENGATEQPIEMESVSEVPEKPEAFEDASINNTQSEEVEDNVDDYTDEDKYEDEELEEVNEDEGSENEDEYEDDEFEYEDEEFEEVDEDEYEDDEYEDEELENEEEYEDGEFADEDEELEEVDEDEYEDDEFEDEDEYEEDEFEDEDEYEDDEFEDEEEYEEDELEGQVDEEYEDEFEYEDDEFEDGVDEDDEFEYEDEEFEDEEDIEDDYEDDFNDEDDLENPDLEEKIVAAATAATTATESEREEKIAKAAKPELDDREIPDDEIPDLLTQTAPLSRKETAKMIATGKTAPLPVDEISNAISMSDTGFIVHGRYDLETQSGIGTRAGLTEDQKKLFSYFVPVRGMSEQLVDVLEQDKNCNKRNGTSCTGNLVIIGRKGSGKTVLAVDVVKAIQKQRKIKQGKVAIVTGDALNKKRVSEILSKLYGGALIIEKAGKMNEKTVARLNKAMEGKTGELLIVLEEQRKPLDRLLTSNKEFRRKFTSRLEVPIFINDELVTFGQTYARENGYRIDEMGILALYSRIDALQREDHAVTVAEVKDIMDEAQEHSKKTSAKKLVKRVFGKSTDEADRIILTEKDFNI